MKKEKKVLKSATIASAIITGSALSLTSANASEASLYDYNDLGAGSEIRTGLLDMNSSLAGNSFDASNEKFAELKCGEGKCGEDKKAKDKKDHDKKEGKAEEGKTEEGKAKNKEAKEGEAKCGEGKCG
jgi:uncharacterized low-complexity protein